MIRAKFTSRATVVAFLGLCSSANAIDIELVPPKGILDWVMIAVGLFFFGWGIYEFVGWMRRRSRNRRDAGENHPHDS